MNDDPLLSVDNLTTEFATSDGAIRAIEDVSFAVDRGETIGIVGESGSGKSVTAHSIMRLLDDNGRIASGSVRLDGTELTTLDETALGSIRGSEIAMVFQDPMTSLTPVLTVGSQLVETLRHHRDLSDEAAKAEAVSLLEDVRLPDPEAAFDAYPHELSGGQRQRALIAIAICCDPDVLIADEPTTALDVTIEAQILDLLEELRETRELSVVLITHDLGVVAETADRVGVMYAGRMVERGPTERVFTEPRHPYTAGLLRSMPRLSGRSPAILEGSVPQPGARPAGCNFAPRCEYATDACRDGNPPFDATDATGRHHDACVRSTELGALDPQPEATEASGASADADSGAGADAGAGERLLEIDDLRKEFDTSTSFVDRILPNGTPPVKAVDGVTLSLREGETVGLVGESGSGKTTLGRLCIALEEATDGEVFLDGVALSETSNAALRERVQFVFQDPSSSLNPRQRIGRILEYAVRKHASLDGGETVADRVVSLLDEVGLDADTRDRYPHELSGGQKQRVGIARALAVDPEILIADEPTSALDVSVQGQILSLLDRIKRRRGLSMLFISHDLSVVRQVSDRVSVMYLGRIVETGPTEALFEAPRHPYTEALLSAIPDPDPRRSSDRIVLEGEIPDPKYPPAGCNFASRCPEAVPECREADPALAPVDGGDRRVACLLRTDAVRGDGDGSAPDGSSEPDRTEGANEGDRSPSAAR